MQQAQQIIELTQETLQRYLKHDLWSIVDTAYLLTGCKPSKYEDLILREDIWAEQRDVYQMARSSVIAGTIKGEGTEVSFRAHPMVWIDWALSKELIIPQIFNEAFQAEQEATIDQPARSQESYRSENERIDKAVVQQVGLVLHAIYPECPITQLVNLPPIQTWVKGRLTKPTLIQWLKDSGIQTKSTGRPSKDDKTACLARMPAEWRGSWK